MKGGTPFPMKSFWIRMKSKRKVLGIFCYYLGYTVVTHLRYYRNDQGETISKLSGHVVEWVVEENYKFRLSAQIPMLQRWLNNEDTQTILPQYCREYIKAGLTKEKIPDLSVSRPRHRMKWGISCPAGIGHEVLLDRVCCRRTNNAS